MILTLFMMIFAVVYTHIFIRHVRNFETDLKGWAIFNHRKTASEELRLSSNESNAGENLVQGDSQTAEVPQIKAVIPRILIQTMQSIPKGLMQEISPRSEWIRVTAKIPMLCILACTGMIGGSSLVLHKMQADLAFEGEMGNHVGFVIFLYAVATPSNITMLIFLQGAMKYYD